MEVGRELIATIRSLFGAGARESQGSSPRVPERDGRFAFNPLDSDYVSDPYPLLTELQDNDPVHKSPYGTWVITRYDDVLAAFSDRRLGNIPSPHAVVHERNMGRYTCADVANNIIPFMDAPAHTGPRKFLSRTFLDFTNASSLDIEHIARSILADHLHRSRIDLLDDFATPLSVRVISQIMGVPTEDEPRLKAWSEWFFYLFSMIPSEQVLQDMNAALEDFRAYFIKLIELRRKHPEDDLISMLLSENCSKTYLSPAALVDQCMLIFSDGVENVDSGIANALHALLRFPQQLRLLSEQPGLVGRAVDECLRYESPGQFVGRVALEDFELHGTSIGKGSGVLLLIGAANRDPRKFEAPEKLDVLRKPNPYLSFGKGRHSCIGAPLVKREMEAAIKVFLEMLPHSSLAESESNWEPRLGHRWIDSLPVNLSLPA